jgi:hypothetical protein
MSANYLVPATFRVGASLALLVGLAGCSTTPEPTATGFGGSGGGSGASTSGSSGSGGSGGSGSSSGASSTSSGGSPGSDASAPIESGVPADGSVPAMDSAAGEGGGSGDGGLSAILVPPQGALLGEYYGDGTIAATNARIGRVPAIHLTYHALSDDFPADPVVRADLAAGQIPQITLDVGDLASIVNGSVDATLRALASGSKALGKKFILDFGAEMNDRADDPPTYVAAYRHAHDLFVAAGATNTVWAWCPNVTDANGGNSMTMAYYPGDAYVDWTGVDGYNWGTSVAGFQWQSFQNLFANIYPLLAAKGKPILIGEMASDEVGGSKGQWIDGIIPALRSSFPLIKAFVWFDVLKERQWQINSSPGSLAAYQRMAKDPFMN